MEGVMEGNQYMDMYLKVSDAVDANILLNQIS